MNVGPERREQNKIARPGRDFELLVQKLGFTARPRHIIYISDRHQLALTELPRASIDMPVVELAGPRTLHVVAHITKRIGCKKRMHSS